MYIWVVCKIIYSSYIQRGSLQPLVALIVQRASSQTLQRETETAADPSIREAATSLSAPIKTMPLSKTPYYDDKMFLTQPSYWNVDMTIFDPEFEWSIAMKRKVNNSNTATATIDVVLMKPLASNILRQVSLNPSNPADLPRRIIIAVYWLIMATTIEYYSLILNEPTNIISWGASSAMQNSRSVLVGPFTLWSLIWHLDFPHQTALAAVTDASSVLFSSLPLWNETNAV